MSGAYETSPRQEEDGWDACTAAGSRAQTLHAFKSLSFIEKIEWLEEAEEIAMRFRAGSLDNRKPGEEYRTEP